MNAYVIIYIGIPASGKTTAAREAVRNNPNAVLVNRDDIRASHGWKHGEAEDRVTQIHQSQIEAGILDGREVHVADTNLNPKFRNRLIKFCHQRGADVEIKTFPISLDEAIMRDAARVDRVGADVVKRFHDQYTQQRVEDALLPVPTWTKYEHADRDSKVNAICVDIDGTVARHWNRSPYDYTKVGDDTPINDVVDIVGALMQEYHVIFVSGRDDSCYDDTHAWLIAVLGTDNFDLLMRKTGDQRPDYVIKNEIYDRDIIPNYNVVMVFDDRDQVVTHLRRRGITVAQVALGRF